MTDIVYINRPGDDNEELRYSLRSLSNLVHERVFIAGAMPSWVDREQVTLIPVPQAGGKQQSAQDNLIAACNHPEVSDPFVVFNDDMFVMQPMEQLPLWHMGSLEEAIKAHPVGSYGTAMRKTRDRMVDLGYSDLGELICWELHTPMEIEKLGMLMALSLGKGIPGLHNRTMYGNLMGLEGEEHPDVKVYRGDKSLGYEAMPLLSTSDRTFKYHPVGRYIHRVFPNKSPYERELRVTRYRSSVRYSSVITHPQ